MAKVLETKVICKQTGCYIGWPTVGQGPDGVLYALFSGDRDGHVDPFGKDFLMRSDDEGKSWSEPEIVNDTPLDDRDTGLCICPDGTLVMTWFTSYYYGRYEVIHAEHLKAGKKVKEWSEWKQTIQSITPEMAETWAPYLIKPSEEESKKWVEAAQALGCHRAVDFEEDHYPPATRRMGYWTRRSRDGGETWDTPTPVQVSAPHGANLMPNGNLIYIGTGDFVSEDGKSRLGVAVSPDQGLTWELTATINASPNIQEKTSRGEPARLCEPHVVSTSSGKLLGLARCEIKDYKKRFLWQFESDNGGKTWTEPVPTQLQGFPPHLLKLRDGRILVSYAIRHDPPGERFCFSSNEGKSWDVENQLTLHDAPDGDLGYPSTVELANGTFVSVYYQKENAGEKPSLMMTRWQE